VVGGGRVAADFSIVQSIVRAATLTAKRAGIRDERRRAAKFTSLRRPLPCLILRPVY
jgi:hypothetical protein